MDRQRLSEFTYYRGRVALYAILRAIGVGPGDEVATQAFTCVAVPEAILACGARPVYVDIEPAGYNIDPGDLCRRLSPQTRAVIVQHTFGIPADMSRIMPIATRAGVPVIEDCCHTLNSTWDGQPVGSYGIASFYSFEWGKPLAIGIGGSAVTNDPALGKRLAAAYRDLQYPAWRRQFRLELQRWAHHALYRPAFYWTLKSLFHKLSKLGAAEGNYHAIDDQSIADDFSLRMAPRLRRTLVNRLRHFEQFATHSRWLASELARVIPEPIAVRPELSAAARAVYARFPLRAADKPRLLAKAREANVELAEWYATPIHPLGREESSQMSYEPASCPEAEARSQEVVSLPLHARVGRAYVERVDHFLQKAA
jgi:dTDP-4-amino-4,6-dideoxygalactose transaminase